MHTVSFKSRRAGGGQEPGPETAAQQAEAQVEVEALAQLWKSTLKVDDVAPGDNFFELGGTSLHAMLLASRVSSELDFELSLVAFFEDPTFSGLCHSVTKPE